MRLVLSSVVATFAVALVAGAPATAADYVYLTPDEEARVVALIQHDPRILAVLGGVHAKVGDVLPWSADGTRETLMGGGTTLTFDSVRDVEADWPLMDFPDGPSEYTITTVHYRVEDADAIDAWVDLRENRVVSFDVIGGTVDESTIQNATVSPPRARSVETDAGGGSRSALLAGLVLVSVLASGIALGHRYGPAGD